VRRAKLYYLRGRTGKSARIAEKQRALLADMGATVETPPTAPEAETENAA
jgi:hypothetical protein